MIRRTLFALLILVPLCGARGADMQVACSGIFSRDTTHDALVREFGEANVVFKPIDGPSSTGMATILFERDAKRRLRVEWFDLKNRAKPIYFAFEGQSQWTGPYGIRIGAPIAEVQKLNGKPFRLNGFGWDLGGATEFAKDSGRLGNLPGGCLYSLTFEPTAVGLPLPSKYRAITGNRDLSSDMPLVLEVKPVVVEVFVVYSGREL